MLDKIYSNLQSSSVSIVIISVTIMLICGFLMTRLTKLLKLPNVTAYIITGILIGPFCLDLIPDNIISGMDFISDIALAFIAFGVGEFFKLDKLKQNGSKVIIITLFEALIATALVFILCFFILKLSFSFSAILGALASATAPASTMMTIRQTDAKGDFVDTLLSVVALDDVVSLVAFSIAIAVSNSQDNVSATSVILPIMYNLILIVIGCLFGFLLKLIMTKRSTDNRLIVSVAFLFGVCGIGALLGVSPLLGCMAMGMTYINVSKDEKLFKQLNYFSPPILLLFFVKSGLGFRLDALFTTNVSFGAVPLIVVGVLYFLVRILGKYFGAFIGAYIVKKPKDTRNYLGLALIPQAGVAIGLAAMGARLLGGTTGQMLETIILSSSILYELIGPACAKLSLYLSHSYGDDVSIVQDKEKIVDRKIEQIDRLKEKVQLIQKEIESVNYANSEEEQAFNEVAFEEYNYNRRYGKHINRR